MKKYLVLFLLFLPMVSYAVPSVRTLGGGKSATPANTTVKSSITPTRLLGATSGTDTSAGGTAEKARLGTLRAKTKVVGVSSTADSSVSRLPGSGAVSTGSGTSSGQSSGTTVVVTGVAADDPRFDAISTVDPSSKHTDSLPNGYVYMWVETE